MCTNNGSHFSLQKLFFTTEITTKITAGQNAKKKKKNKRSCDGCPVPTDASTTQFLQVSLVLLLKWVWKDF